MTTLSHHRKRNWSQYNRTARSQVKLAKVADSCHKIEEFFPILNEMELILSENKRLRNIVLSLNKNIPKNCDYATEDLSQLLKLLLECAKSNAGRKPGGMRYNTTIKEFATLCFTLGGPQLYEIFQKNLHFPSISTARRCLTASDPIQEGVFRISQLKHRMESMGIKTVKVHVSEDGTSLNGRVQYDIKTNQLVGFVPKLRNGLPVPNGFPATSASEMQSHFKENTVSKNAYAIMAQPLDSKSPAFCVALYGTDNKFLHTDVIQRWHWMRRAFLEAGLEIDGFSADGDSKILKAMYMSTFSFAGLSKWKWFHSSLSINEPVMIQDTIHLLVKLKSKLLKPSEIIPFGKTHVASKGHLVALLNEVSKDHHKLNKTILNPKDKMNFKAAQMLCDSKVPELLRKEVPGSEATALYLDMMREVTSVFLDHLLPPLERVSLIWKWIFFLRLWRKWLLATDGYTLGHNFITSNAYVCIELNGHGIIKLIRKRREAEEADIFLPCLCGSQQCEDCFRRLRAMSGTQSSVVVFSMLEMQHRIRRVDFLGDSFINLKDTIHFPRLKKQFCSPATEQQTILVLPEDYEIEATVEAAFKLALDMCIKFGIAKQQTPIPNCQLPLVSSDTLDDILQELVLDDDVTLDEDEVIVESEDEQPTNAEAAKDDTDEDLVDVTEDLLIVSSGSLGLKSNDDVVATPTSPFVKVLDGNGKTCIIKKTSFCWLLSSGDTKMSSDRLSRVQANQVSHGTLISLPNLQSLVPHQEDTVSIGDWCAFTEGKSIVVGRILAFSYMSGSTWRSQEYSATSAPVKAPDHARRGLGCMCSWFSISNRKLKSITMDNHGYYDIEKYICTLPRPMVLKKDLVLQCHLQDIKKLVKS